MGVGGTRVRKGFGRRNALEGDGGEITEDSYREAAMQNWERSAWNDRAPRSHTEVIAEAEPGCITWIPNASAAGNARGDEDAVAFTESPDADADADTVESADEFQGGDRVISDDWFDPDDADAFAATETTRECDSARAEIADSFFAVAEARDDGVTSEESVSSLSSWARFPRQTQAAG